MDKHSLIRTVVLGLAVFGILAAYVLLFYSVAKQNRMEKGKYPTASKPNKETRKEVNRLLSLDESERVSLPKSIS
jgi:hypothetical protein